MINPETLNIKLIDFGVAKIYNVNEDNSSKSESSYQSYNSIQSKEQEVTNNQLYNNDQDLEI